MKDIFKKILKILAGMCIAVAILFSAFIAWAAFQLFILCLALF